MKTAQARARFSVPAPRELSSLRRRSPFALEPPAELPDLGARRDRAVRLGHRLQTSAGPAWASVGRGEAVQRASDDEEESSSSESSEDSDETYYEPPSIKRKTQDPKSAMSMNTYKKTATGLEYETVGGAKHVESFDPKKLTRFTRTTGLQMAGPGFRNNAKRDDVQHEVFNLYGLSPGQSALNQSVVSHNSPSWAGMRAGGQYGNSSESSGHFNSQVEKKEKKWRDKLQNTQEPIEYATETELEKLGANPRHDEIAARMTNPKWQDPERIKKRFQKIVEKNPEAMRIKSERRTLTAKIAGKRKRQTMNLGADLLLGIPRRAFDSTAHKKYIAARGQDSEGSDRELEQKRPRKKRKTAK